MPKSSRRLHPLAIVLMFVGSIKNWFILGLILFPVISNFAKQFSLSGLFIYTILILLLFAYDCFRYAFFTYEIGADSLTINSGLIVRKHTHIPFERIQSIEQNQWFFFKPFNLVKLSIETASQSDKAEATLPLVKATVATEIGQRRTQDVPTEVNEVVPALATYQIANRDLNLYALTSLGIIPIFIALSWVYNRVVDVLPSTWQTNAGQSLQKLSIAYLIIVIVVVFIIGLAFSYLNILQKYYHFNLARIGNRLEAERGLFKTNHYSLPINRIQAVSFKQNILRQLLQLTTITTITASKQDDDDKNENITIMPVIKDNAAFSYLHPFINWVSLDAPKLQKLTPNRYWLFIRNSVATVLIPIFLCLWFLRPWGWLSLLLIPWAMGQGWYSAKSTGWLIENDQLILQTGHWFNRSLTVIPHLNIQSLAFRQSVWMTRTHLAHLTVNVRQGNGNQEVEVRYLPENVVRDIYKWYRQ